MLRFIHIADLHASRERLKKDLEVLGKVESAAEGVDFVAFAGDFFDSLITNTEASGFTALVSAMERIAKKTKVYMVYGTPTHEPNGCLDIFKAVGCEVFREKAFVETDKCDLVFLPEPRLMDYKDSKDVLKSYTDFAKSVPAEKTKPRVCVYHGEVRGATYQNGVEAACPHALPKRIFETLQCDYCAFGHIHKPQEVFKNAFYAGTPIPLNFGEEHNGHYNLVEIGKNVKVTEVPTDMPRYKTLAYQEYLALESKYLGANWHLRIRIFGKESERQEIEADFRRRLGPQIQGVTAACEVRLQFEPTEEVKARSEEIRKIETLSEKLDEYAKVMKLNVPKGAKDALEEIEAFELIRKPTPNHAFELLSVELRGAKGIKDGCGKDEIFVDFEKLENGLTVIMGENGRGKTTFLENCTPYPFMLTRGGALREHFYSERSYRETVWRDENGKYYKLRISIKGTGVRAKTICEAWTSTDREDWRPAIGVDGTIATYTEWVNSVFGPVDLYMRTAFQAKEKSDRVPDIAEATRGERIELFSALAGISQMRDVSLAAREKAKEAEEAVKESDTAIKALQESADTELLDVKIIKLRRDLKKAEDDLAEKEAKRDELIELDAKIKAQRAEMALKQKMADDLKRRITKDGQEIAEKTVELKDVTAYFKNEGNILRYKQSVVKCEAAKDAWVKASGALNELYTRNNALVSEISEKEKPLNEAERQIGVLNAKIATLEETELEVGDRCPVCGAAIDEKVRSDLILHNFEAKRGADALKANLKVMKSKKTKLDNAIRELRDEQLELAKKIAEDEKTVKGLAEKKKETESKMRALEIYKPKREHTEYERDALEKSIKELKAEIARSEKELKEIKIVEVTEDVSEDLAELKSVCSDLKAEATEFKAELKASEALKKSAEENAKKIKEWEKKRAEGKEKSDACRFLETAFGQKGVPALELENTAPEIQVTANSILREIFDGRFTIEIQPTRQGTEKQIVDFSVIVRDARSKWEKSLELVSSGEKVWIKQALYGAFSIVLSRQTGLTHKVRFVDEADGTLFAGQRGEFIKLLQKISELSGATKTVIITQSQEVKDCVEQKIEF